MKLPRRSAVTVALLLTVGCAIAGAAGVSEQEFNDWYADVSNRYATDQTRNTGLTVFPSLNIPMGGEFEGLGTAYTGAARDASFLEANPAASSRLEFTELAVFHNDLIADASLEALAYTTRHDDLGIGIGGKFVHVPFSSYDDYASQVATARYTETVMTLNASYNFLSSFYFTGISAGMNIKGAYRNIPEVIAPGQSAAGVLVDLGLLTYFDLFKFYSSQSRNASVGVALRNAGPNVLGEPPPTVLATGIGYSPFRPLLFTADFLLPFNPFSEVPAEDPGFATGAAVSVTDFFVVRSGFLVRGGNPRITMGGSVTVDRVIVTANFTLDMTTQLSSFDRFSLKAAFDLGDRGRAVRQERVRTYYLDSLQAFAIGELEDTVELAQRALALDPTFEPAEETLRMALRMQELQNQMDSIRLGEDSDLRESSSD